MNNTPSVATVCALDNQKNIPHDTIDCICAQTLEPHSLIIIYDEALEVAIKPLQTSIKKVAPTLQVKYIKRNSNDIASTRNIGLDYISDYQYVHFADANTRLPRDFYQKATLSLAKSSDYVAAVPERLELTSKKKTDIDLSGLADNPWLWLMRSKLEIAGMVLLRKDAVEKAGKFNPLMTMGADTDFYSRISNQGAWYCIQHCTATRLQSSSAADLQDQFSDYHRQWALIYENLLDTYGARYHIAKRVYRAILADAWCRAGQELLTGKRIEEAHDCFTRSLSWRVVNPSWKYLIKISRLRRAKHRP
ncbi:MAG: glycosyltransferase family 2 protein [Chromatiales bacterium]|nr:glycosyltransferase family 2 protein [Chromatiales bacterium]